MRSQEQHSTRCDKCDKGKGPTTILFVWLSRELTTLSVSECRHVKSHQKIQQQQQQQRGIECPEPLTVAKQPQEDVKYTHADKRRWPWEVRSDRREWRRGKRMKGTVTWRAVLRLHYLDEDITEVYTWRIILCNTNFVTRVQRRLLHLMVWGIGNDGGKGVNPTTWAWFPFINISDGKNQSPITGGRSIVQGRWRAIRCLQIKGKNRK